MPSINWTPENDRKLLLFIVSQPDVKVDAVGAAAMMATGDITCTKNAIQKRLQRLKELAKTSDIGEASTTAAPKGKKGGGKRAKAAQDDDDDDDDEDASPRKKGKKAVASDNKGKKAASESDREDQEGEDGVKPEPVDYEEF